MVRFLFTSTLIISPFPNYLPNSSGSELLVILHMQADVGPFMPPKVLEHAYLKADVGTISGWFLLSSLLRLGTTSILKL